MFENIRLLKLLGYEPTLIIDAGAHHGNWTDKVLKIYPDAEYCLFEPIKYEELRRFKKNSSVRVRNVILNDKKEIVKWYEKRNTGDSMFKEKTVHFEDVVPTERETTTLDDELKTDHRNILLKIDCQGAEIPILKGAKNILKYTDFVILEIPFFGEYNVGVGTFLDHIKYMDEIGFVPYDFLETHRLGGFTIQVDVMFINRNHSFNKKVDEKIKY